MGWCAPPTAVYGDSGCRRTGSVCSGHSGRMAGDWGVRGSGFVCVIPGVLTWIGLALRHPPTVAAAH